MERAVLDVFEPGSRQIRRAVGHPAAPLMVDSVIGVTKARLTAVQRLRDGLVSDEAFYQARRAHLMVYAEYAVTQPTYAGSAPPDHPDKYEPVPAENALNDCCTHLLTTIGLEAMYPERAAQLRANAGSADLHTIPRSVRQAILRMP